MNQLAASAHVIITAQEVDRKTVFKRHKKNNAKFLSRKDSICILTKDWTKKTADHNSSGEQWAMHLSLSSIGGGGQGVQTVHHFFIHFGLVSSQELQAASLKVFLGQLSQVPYFGGLWQFGPRPNGNDMLNWVSSSGRFMAGVKELYEWKNYSLTIICKWNVTVMWCDVTWCKWIKSWSHFGFWVPMSHRAYRRCHIDFMSGTAKQPQQNNLQ